MAAERLPRIAAAICPICEIALRFQPVVRHLANPVRIDKNMGSRELNGRKPTGRNSRCQVCRNSRRLISYRLRCDIPI